MSYLRWSESCPWYVYHDVSSGETRDTQVLTVCGERSFTYAELKNDFEGAMSLLQASSRKWDRLATDGDMAMIREALEDFMENMEADYPDAHL